MLKRKNNEEVIEMEQTTFIQKHAKKILVAGGLVVTAGAAYLLYKHNVDIAKHNAEIAEHDLRLTKVENKLIANTEIAVKALEDKIRDLDFEIGELIFKRDNLDQSATQNIFMNIPKLNEEIELKNVLKENTKALLEKAIENGKTE